MAEEAGAHTRQTSKEPVEENGGGDEVEGGKKDNGESPRRSGRKSQRKNAHEDHDEEPVAGTSSEALKKGNLKKTSPKKKVRYQPNSEARL